MCVCVCVCVRVRVGKWKYKTRRMKERWNNKNGIQSCANMKLSLCNCMMRPLFVSRPKRNCLSGIRTLTHTHTHTHCERHVKVSPKINGMVGLSNSINTIQCE